MAQYTVHKKGFFYTDECYEAEENVHGSILAVYNNIEDAREAKRLADIKSIQNLAGENIVDFFFSSPNHKIVYKTLEKYYKVEFELEIEDRYYFDFPDEISQIQAQKLLDILDVSFHDIVEYEDDRELSSKDFTHPEFDEF